MKITQNRYLKTVKFAAGPAVIALGMLVNDSITWYVALLLLLIPLILFMAIATKLSAVLFETTDEGVVVSGSRTGIYDPEFIAYSDIASVAARKREVSITRTGGQVVDLALPKKYVDKVQRAISDEIQQ